MNKVLVYSPMHHPRLEYVIQYIQGYQGQFDWILTHSLADYLSFLGPCINYGVTRLRENEYFIHDSKWLYKSIEDYQFIPNKFKSFQFVLFPESNSDQFDVFAAIFYLVSRAEEYLPGSRDSLGRFRGKQSILFNNDVMHIPIVDVWVFQLINRLEMIFKIKIPIRRMIPEWSLGIDVDQFFKYQFKSFTKIIGGTIRSLFKGHFNDLKQRLKTYSNFQNDPYNSFSYLEKLAINKYQFYFFILSGGASRFDINHRLDLPEVRSIIHFIQSFGTIGLHPSYSSTENFDEIAYEKNRLQQIVELPIRCSRQHYLKILFPETFHHLIRNDIELDFSMGYPDMTGFRAGTSRPFKWYDISKEETTKLTVQPFMAMDRTYLDYLKIEPAAAAREMIHLFDITIKYGGHFHIIFHNSSFDFQMEWKGWEGILDYLVHYFKEYNKDKK